LIASLKVMLHKFGLSVWAVTSMVVLTSGCSIYQSEGKKILNQQAFALAGAALLACGDLGQTQDGGPWRREREDAENQSAEGPSAVKIWSIQTKNVDILIQPIEHNIAGFGCHFLFRNEESFQQARGEAIELTLSKFTLALSPD
jgi:hypothetical protein